MLFLEFLGLYLASGILVALPFVARGVDAGDPAAAGGGWGFRLLILPGCALLWPWVVRQVLHARRESHRAAMRARRRK